MDKCRWCGNTHGPLCPAVKSIEYDGTGIIVKRVEFFAPNDYAPKMGGLQWSSAAPFAPFGPAISRGDGKQVVHSEGIEKFIG